MNRRELLRGIIAASAAVAMPAITLAETLSSRIEIYEFCGMTAFPEVSANGSYISRTVVFPLIRESETSWVVYGYRSDLETHFAQRDEYLTRLHQDAKSSFSAALRTGEPIIERGEGGYMPSHREIVRFTKGR